jgi:hypothetical protein
MLINKIKATIILLFVSSLLLCFSKVIDTNIKIERPLTFSTLDSLQGKWMNNDDSNNRIEIIGRYWIDSGIDYQSDTTYVNYSKIFFTDSVHLLNDTIYPVFDTSALTGKYLVFLNLPDSSTECFEFNGFFYGSEYTTFSFQPIRYWTASSILRFKKVQ